jgi:RNA polymerase sigma-70 factor (ECF subfamily)
MPSGSNPPVAGDKSVAALLQATRDGSRSKFGELLERTRRYLLLVANRSLDGELQQKQAASDLVQETFLEARRNFAQFRGESEAELFAWLCRILENKGRDATRRFRVASMRDVSRE